MTKVSIEVKSVDSNSKTQTDKITYINPSATNDQIKEFAQTLIALTDNTYTSLTKITEEAIV